MRFCTAWKVRGPPIHLPFLREAGTLSFTRSEASSRSNWAKDSSTLRVRRPIEVQVLNCCVTATNHTLRASKISTSLAKSASQRVRRSIDYDDIAGFAQAFEGRALH